MDADPEVGATDRTGAERHRGPAGQLAMRLGHERGRAFVACRDDADPGALEGIEQAEERLARDREGVADAGRAQRVGDEPADGPRAFCDDGCEVRSRHSLGRLGVGRGLGLGLRLGLSLCGRLGRGSVFRVG